MVLLATSSWSSDENGNFSAHKYFLCIENVHSMVECKCNRWTDLQVMYIIRQNIKLLLIPDRTVSDVCISDQSERLFAIHLSYMVKYFILTKYVQL